VKTANINMGEGNKGYLTTKQQKSLYLSYYYPAVG